MRNGERPRTDGRAVPLCQLMKDAVLTKAAFSLLDESQANSDALVAREEMAMDRVKQGGEANMANARTLMHDSIYHAGKTKIMDPIGRVFVKPVDRTQVNEASHDVNQAAAAAILRPRSCRVWVPT